MKPEPQFCVCCNKPGKRLEKMDGSFFGPACDAHAGLAWLLDFDSREGNADKYQRDVARWMQRREMALCNGKPFTESAPKSPAEKDLETIIIERGWFEAARALEPK